MVTHASTTPKNASDSRRPWSCRRPCLPFLHPRRSVTSHHPPPRHFLPEHALLLLQHPTVQQLHLLRLQPKHEHQSMRRVGRCPEARFRKLLFMKSAPNSFRKAMEVAVSETGRKVSCLVSDAFFWFAGEMAEEKGVAWLPFWTAGPASLSAHVYTDLIRETFGVGGQEDELLSLIPGMSKIRTRDLPEGVLFGNLES
uniref:Anthocyanidin 3-O-glucosyltransferase n=1 Tax=Salix viminalis TaxID=40686 RepID=A0A6N2MAQ5_SALVM